MTCIMGTSLVSFTSSSAQAAPNNSHIVPKVLLHCDGTATDAKMSNDCIQAIAIGDAADGKTTGGKPSKIAVTIAPELRGKSLLGEVQYRSVYNNGSRGKWWTHRTIVWHAKDTRKSPKKTFSACSPVKAGKYETRTLLAVPVSKEIRQTGITTTQTNRARAFDSATASPTPSTQVTSTTTPSSAAATPTASVTPSKSATPVASASASASAKPTSSASSTASASATPTTKPSASPTTTASTQVTQAPYTTSDAIAASSVSSLAVTQSASSGSCSNSSADEMLIEYFNQINFQQDIQILITQTATAYNIQITCPMEPSASIPGPAFDLTLTSIDGSMSTNCNGNQPISVNKSQLGSYNFCTVNSCKFTVVDSNASTGTVYSTTVIQIMLTPGNQTLLPSLNPATLPVCNNTLNACLLSGTCSLSNSKEGALSLCAGSATCNNSPATNTGGYSLNQNVYFQTMITNKVT